MQPVTHCILLDLLCKTKTFWVFLRSFLLYIPSFLLSEFIFFVLLLPAPCDDSFSTAAHPTRLAEPPTLLTSSKIKHILMYFPA